MIPYYLFFFITALAVVFESNQENNNNSPRNREISFLGCIFLFIASLFIGTRLHVGADYDLYSLNFDNLLSNNFYDLFFSTSSYLARDIGYEFISLLAKNLNLGFEAATLIAGFLFSLGLVKFCFTLSRPWLALLVSIPYVVIVIAMGYMRQGVAIAFLMWAISYLIEEKKIEYFALLFIGALFHKTAAIFIFLSALVFNEDRFKAIILFILFFPLLYVLIIAETIADLSNNYISLNQQSGGAFIRLLLTFTSGVLYFFFIYEKSSDLTEKKIWMWFSIFSFVLLALYFLISSSTAVDRIALYLVPLQIYVFSTLPDNLTSKEGARNFLWVFFVMSVFLVVLIIWLTFGAHASYWLPYQSWLVMPEIVIRHT